MRLGRRVRLGRIVIPAMLLIAAGVLVAARSTTVSAQQPPTFRSSIDLVAVDVQVVDKTGRPINSLKPSDFEVEINGKRRRVVSADFVESASVDSASGGAGIEKWRPEPTDAGPGEPGAGRTFVLAFDTDSFTVNESRDVVAAARTFIHELRPSDAVGLYTFPVGPRHEPTLEHVAVSKLVDTIVGRSQSMIGEYNLSPSEIVDITAEAARDFSQALNRPMTSATNGGANANVNAAGGTNSGGQQASATVADTALQRVQLRECGAIESSCADSIRAEANSKAFYLEGRATEGLNGLRALIQLLGEQPGRKTVVVMSTGIPATDRPGGRPDVGDIAKLLGQDAAATNTTIYTLLVNTRGFQSMASETRKNDRIPTSLSRDSAVSSRLLEEFSGASGGALLRVLIGGGDVALNRVLRETSSHYLLGVEPADTDRDGSLRELRVKVGQSGATIRARSWVVVPKRKI
jgi:VWFA-related protein